MKDIHEENYSLLLGDCLERMKEIPDGCIDFVLTDPPYGTTACKWDSVIPFKPMWKEIWRVCKPNAAVALFGVNPFFSKLITSQLSWFRYELIWEKDQASNFMFLKNQFGRIHENIGMFYQKQPTYNPQMKQGSRPSQGGTSKKSNKSKVYLNQSFKAGDAKGQLLRYPNGVFKFTKVKKAAHPTQKPVELLEYLIKTYTNEGETVLDFTMGSGSTGVAAKNLNRQFIGIEMDASYFEIADKRIRGEEIVKKKEVKK